LDGFFEILHQLTWLIHYVPAADSVFASMVCIWQRRTEHTARSTDPVSPVPDGDDKKRHSSDRCLSPERYWSGIEGAAVWLFKFEWAVAKAKFWLEALKI